MTHLSDDDLVLLHYGEGAGSEAEGHLAGCVECAERLKALGRMLALASLPEGPERGEDYGSRVWERLRPQLGLAEPRPKVVPIRRRLWPRAVSVAALVAALVLAFLLGRRFPDQPQPLSAEVRERLLLVAVGEHLERSQMVLVELVNEELERVLAEVAAGPDALSPGDLAELQRRIESRGLLFRVRVIGSQVREREKNLLPRAVSSS